MMVMGVKLGASEVNVEGWIPAGRPRKAWRWCVEEDARRVNIVESGRDSQPG